MIVVDASAIVDVVARLPRAPGVSARLAGQQLVAPELLDVEVLSALAHLERAGALHRPDADAAARALARLPVRRISHVLLRDRAWALRNRIRLADAFYVACAQLTSAPLVTTDARLGRAAPPDLSLLLVT